MPTLGVRRSRVLVLRTLLLYLKELLTPRKLFLHLPLPLPEGAGDADLLQFSAMSEDDWGPTCCCPVIVLATRERVGAYTQPPPALALLLAPRKRDGAPALPSNRLIVLLGPSMKVGAPALPTPATPSPPPSDCSSSFTCDRDKEVIPQLDGQLGSPPTSPPLALTYTAPSNIS